MPLTIVKSLDITASIVVWSTITIVLIGATIKVVVITIGAPHSIITSVTEDVIVLIATQRLSLPA